jgi:hypothetical protein
VVQITRLDGHVATGFANFVVTSPRAHPGPRAHPASPHSTSREGAPWSRHCIASSGRAETRRSRRARGCLVRLAEMTIACNTSAAEIEPVTPPSGGCQPLVEDHGPHPAFFLQIGACWCRAANIERRAAVGRAGQTAACAAIQLVTLARGRAPHLYSEGLETFAEVWHRGGLCQRGTPVRVRQGERPG